MAEYIIDKIAYNGDVYKLQDNQSGYITTETDPVFSASAAAGISATDISNWNAKSDTDEKLKVEQQAASTTYFPIVSSDSTTASTKYYNPYYRFYYDSSWAYLEVGDNNRTGILKFGRGNYLNSLFTDSLTADHQIKLPDKSGTVALTSDVPSISLNGSSTTSASFYAPTSAGTSGYYLKSNGSGAPTWATIPAGVTVTLNGSTTTTPSFYAPTTAGTSGQVLTSNGSGAPTWAAAGGSSTQIIRWTES